MNIFKITKEDIVYSKGNLANKVYFILKGKILMVSEDYHNLPIALYEEGSFFGEIEVFKNLKRCFTCIAADNLELLAMEKADFKKIFGRYNPDLFKLFLVVVEHRWTDVEIMLQFIGNLVDPNHQNTDAIKLTKKIKEENQIVARISRQTSAFVTCRFFIIKFINNLFFIISIYL